MQLTKLISPNPENPLIICFRVTDWTFDLTSLTTDELQNIGDLCQQMGWGFTYSNVQCHIKPQGQDKAVGLLKVLRQYFPDILTRTGYHCW